MRKFNAPLHAETPCGRSASPAPQIPSRNGTLRLSRRALIAGALSLAAGAARGATLRLEAGPQGYNGASPGPLLRGKAGQPMRIELANRLSSPTSLRLPQGAGGYAGLTGPALAPGETRAFAFTPAAACFDLYLPFGPAAGEQQAGLFGAIMIDEPSPPPVDLDAVAIFSGPDAGALRVNGEPAPLKLAAPPGARVRLRLANAAPDLLLGLHAEGVVIVAIDGRPSEPFAPANGAFALAPGARFELMFDLDGPFALAARGGPAVSIAPQGARVGPRPSIAALPPDPRLPSEIALERALRARVEIAEGAGFTINGVGGADWPAEPLFRVRRGAPVALTLVNRTAEPQTLRLEGHAARLLHAFDDGWDPYWRDTLHLPPGGTLHAAFVAGQPGKWPLASASPDSRAKGLKAWFETT
jgi:FtsP/CotA-like multicopper oxidase with cupredoxin domain